MGGRSRGAPRAGRSSVLCGPWPPPCAGPGPGPCPCPCGGAGGRPRCCWGSRWQARPACPCPALSMCPHGGSWGLLPARDRLQDGVPCPAGSWCQAPLAARGLACAHGQSNAACCLRPRSQPGQLVTPMLHPLQVAVAAGRARARNGARCCSFPTSACARSSGRPSVRRGSAGCAACWAAPVLHTQRHDLAAPCLLSQEGGRALSCCDTEHLVCSILTSTGAGGIGVGWLPGNPSIAPQGPLGCGAPPETCTPCQGPRAKRRLQMQLVALGSLLLLQALPVPWHQAEATSDHS